MRPRALIRQRRFFWLVIMVVLLLGTGQRISAMATEPPADVVINELMAANGSGLTDEDGEYSDWIELYNRSDEPVNLSGYSLTDDPTQPQKWPLPGVTLPSQAYLVIFASSKNRMAVTPGAVLHTNFRLSKEGDFLGLYNILEGRFMDSLAPQYPAQFRDVAYGRTGATGEFGYLARPTPGGPNEGTETWPGAVTPVEFSVERGLYNEPVTVALSTATGGATIRYTLDGRAPSESEGLIYRAPLVITTTTLVRAAAYKADYLPSPETTHSYIFPAAVLAQPAAPPGLPADWGTTLVDGPGYTTVEPKAADYAMNPDVVNNPQAQEMVRDSLAAIPNLSVVMPTADLASLYTPVGDGGPNSAHLVSVELFYPDGSQPGFQVNAGLTLNRPDQSASLGPKQSFRLSFKTEYGAAKLVYPLFHDAPAEEFDNLVLQAGFPMDPASYSRNEWLRESQVAMSGLGAHGMAVHLYLNGLYWGVYTLMERPNAAFMATYLDGEKEDWFAADQEGPLDKPGDSGVSSLDYLFMGLSLAGRGSSREETQQLYATVAPVLDPAQFSDYVILTWYAQMLEWPEQRWYVGIQRQGQGDRGKFLFGEETISPANPAGQASGPTPSMNITQGLLDTLMENSDFRVQFADRLYKHLYKEGALADAQAQARWLQVSREVEPAMAAEAARWGDAGSEPALTGPGWQQVQDNILARLEGQAARLIERAREAGAYPNLEPPEFSQPGGTVKAGATVTLTQAGDGTIYYTVDGSDPRMPVTGEPGPTASVYDQTLVLKNNATIKARILAKDTSAGAEPVWSALQEATFSIVQQNNPLRLTEIMYNPIGGDDYEFVELQNVGDQEVELAGLAFEEGIDFFFPPDTPPLAPGKFVVLVSNAETFAQHYPEVPIGGTYDGHLSNKGEEVILFDAQKQPLVDVTYDDDNGWPVSADGRGDSIVLKNLDGDPNDPRNWRASIKVDGSPGMSE